MFELVIAAYGLAELDLLTSFVLHITRDTQVV
jgi:hypothetical protein